MDTTWLYAINNVARATGWAHPIMIDYANYGVVLFGALLLAGWWMSRRAGDLPKVAAAWCSGAAVLIAVAVNQPIVSLVARPRPYTTHPDLLILAHRSTDWSFPSDHATVAGAAAVGLLLISRRLGAVAAVAAVIMAFARVYIGAHYPSDVLAGLLFGATVAVVTYVAAHRLLTRLAIRMMRTPLRTLVTAQPPTAV